MKKVMLDGAELHYIEAGEGVAFAFVHGGLEDLRTWESHVEHFSRFGRAIAYSRRYNYPNATPPFRQDHSAKTEADDLVQFITALNLGPINVVGSSYGAYTALFLVLRRPDPARAAVLSEAPVIGWLPSIEEDKLSSTTTTAIGGALPPRLLRAVTRNSPLRPRSTGGKHRERCSMGRH